MIYKYKNIIKKSLLQTTLRYSHAIRAPVIILSRCKHILSTRNINPRSPSQFLFRNDLPVILLPSSNLSILPLIMRVAKLRYLVYTGMVAGGTSAYRTIDSWWDQLPDLSWMKEVMPDMEVLITTKNKIIEASKNIQFPDISSYMPSEFPDIKSLVPSELPDVSSYIPSDYPFLVNSKEWLQKQIEEITAIEAQNLSNDTLSFGKATPYTLEEQQEIDEIREKKKKEELHERVITQRKELQDEMERLRRDNRDLRKQMLLRQVSDLKGRRIKTSLIDMYSEVLDELADFDAGYNTQDHLPRVVVVGDQSSGKTSVLEMIAQARIFPRGSGEMMTRSPVKVTLSEGPYHVAKFNNHHREYDLTKEGELKLLRGEIEKRMRASVSKGQTVSGETISLTVKGPGLQRIVLVDLPGIISTVTNDMAWDTKDKIRGICKSHLENPNAIILCVQDGSLDAERSNVTDLVSSMDQSGKRTIFVLTKVDVAESNQFDTNRIRKILEGRLFPMKALGYFAVVTGKGNSNDSIQDIKDYEEEFFKNSLLTKDKVLRHEQMKTRNLSVAVSKCFWKMVRDSIEQQADAFRATRFNLETEWKNTFPKKRELQKEELFEKARGDILDEVVNLSQIPAKEWESVFDKNLWSRISDDVINNIYLPASMAESPRVFNTLVDINLKKWTEKTLPKICVEVGKETIQSEFQKLLLSEKVGHDPIYDDLYNEVSQHQHNWDKKAEDSLRVVQASSLDDVDMGDKKKWEASVRFMETVVQEKLTQSEEEYQQLIGPSKTSQWLRWTYRSEEQDKKRHVAKELEKLVLPGKRGTLELTDDELTAVRKNLENIQVGVDNETIRGTWKHLHKVEALKKALKVGAQCKKGYYYYDRYASDDEDMSCKDVVFFSRLQHVMASSNRALRQHVINNEIRRFEHRIKGVLEEIGDDKEKLGRLFQGRRVALAEELKRVRQVQELLEEFNKALHKEKP